MSHNKYGRGGGRGRGSRGGGGGGGGGNYHKSSNFSYKNQLCENMSGFLCSCNFCEKDCIKEASNLLNEYAQDQDFKPIKLETTKSSEGTAEENLPQNMEEKAIDEDDIEKLMKAEVAEINSVYNKSKFSVVQTGVPNLVFIKSTVIDPSAFAYRILDDIHSKKEQKSKYLLRLLPIQITTKAYNDSIEKACRSLFPKFFEKKDYISFQIVFKSRHNNKLDRSEIIELLANIVMSINPLSVVDLTSPKLSIIVEVIKNVACIGVLVDFNKLKRYNLLEVASGDEKKIKTEEKNEPEKDEVGGGDEKKIKTEEKNEEICADDGGDEKKIKTKDENEAEESNEVQEPSHNDPEK